MRPAPMAHGPEPCRQGPAAPPPSVAGAVGPAAHGHGHGASPSSPPAAANVVVRPAPSTRRRHQQNDDENTQSLLPKPFIPGNKPPGLIPPGPKHPWLLLALAPLPPLPRPALLRPRPFFRYWIDSQALSSAASTVLLERALVALGGRRTGGPPKLELGGDGEEGHGGGRRTAAEAARALAAAGLKPGSVAPSSSSSALIPTTPTPRDYGYMHMGEWDFLWSITAKAMLAAELLRAGQLVSVVPGCLSISRKTSLVRSLVQSYGRGAAFGVVPLTFKLPEELDAWARVLEQEGREMGVEAGAMAQGDAGPGRPAGGEQPPPLYPRPLWMLKNNKQRGTGLRLIPGGPGAFRAAFETAYRPGKMAGLPLYRWYLAQRYVSSPLLLRPYGGTLDWIEASKEEKGEKQNDDAVKPRARVDNRPRKFGVRVWALVPSAAPPFRAYIHTRGLALFSSRPYTTDPWAAAVDQEQVTPQSSSPEAPSPAVPEGHLTNAARNAGAPVWPLHRLAESLGPQAWRELWEQLCRSTALALAASARRVRELRAELALPRGGAFQLFGLDFVVDASLKPWLLEVNATPSMRVDHPCPASAAVVEGEKWPAVWDAMAVLRVAPERFAASSAEGGGGAASSSSSSSSSRGRRWSFFGRRRQGGIGKARTGAGGGGGSDDDDGGGDLSSTAEDAPEASVADVAAEMRRAGGYVPLTHLFPDAETLPGCSVPWTAADDALRRWLRREEAEERRRRRRGGGGEEASFAWHAWSH